ncbi:hypothetical protein [Paraburkholderia susongensis]|uniref:Uncharacterized protein n=1 Tax=Paraburkholderia susongensis TaxID=1515439 RepID=A0A1X7LFN0_9BURK|nr:hypothetical protein [Paraburkholderia susongensis]SMG52661.1 hypothetical protein SAMN06265784_10612 [Paraburkholderia susongensis]
MKQVRSRSYVQGRLIAVTPVGPVYKGSGDIAVLPVSVGLALIQELALRAQNGDAKVVSSLASRVSGEQALATWAHVCGCAVSHLGALVPQARLVFLRSIFAYARRQGNANGIEPVLTAAINGAWPWLGTAGESVLRYANQFLRDSKFASTVEIPVLDPINRTMSVFRPGDLGRLDPTDWMSWQKISTLGANANRGSWDGTGTAGGLGGLGVPGRRGGLDFTQWGGPDLSGSGDPGLGGLTGLGVPGGRGGPDLSAWGGPDLSGGGQPSLGGLSGLGVPGNKSGIDFSAWGGPNLGEANDLGLGGLSGIGVPGGGLDLTNIGGNGGPYGFGSALGLGGAATPLDAEKTAGANEKTKGQIEIAAGLAIGLAGVGLSASAPPVGWALAFVGGVIAGKGIADFESGSKREENAALQMPGAPAPAPQTPTTPAPTPEPAPEPEPDENGNKPKPEGAKTGDLYPDPDGTGGGNPTQLPDFDGHGGNPTTLWDEGHGGNPTTIWDENGGGENPVTIWDGDGGGVTPTTIARIERVTMLGGLGLFGDVSQIGAQTYIVRP